MSKSFRIPIIAVGFMLASLWGASAAHAQDFAKLFDTPLSHQVVAGSNDRPEVTCIWFADLMVRELATDGPGGGPSTMVPLAAGAPRPACNAGSYPAGHAVENANALLQGRKGTYLMFDIYSPAGAAKFEIVDSRTARVLYTDALSPTTDGLQHIAVEGASLHLRFTRQIDAPCSLALDVASCWAKLLRTKSIPAALATAPPASICTQAYSHAQDKPDDLSEVLYDVDMMLDPAGKTRVLSRGMIRCEPSS